MKTHELFEQTDEQPELKQMITRALDQAITRTPDVIGWGPGGPGSAEWQGTSEDFDSYYEVLVDQTYDILGGVRLLVRTYGKQGPQLVHKMVRRRVIAIKRQAE